MDSKLTPLDETKICIEKNQNFVLQGGAGSGKTETLKQLLEYISENYPDKKIACITHTNLAVDEIKSRVGEQYTISTIHSFLNTLTKDYKKNIKQIIFGIFELSKVVRKDIDYYEDDKHQKKEEHDNYKKVHSKYAARLFTINKESASKVEGKREYDQNPEHFNEVLNAKVSMLNNKILEQIEEKDYNEIKYNETSFNDFKELTYGHDSLLEIAYMLFEKYELLGKILQDKYDIIFIDEYQDTNKKIIDIFLKLLPQKKKTIIGLFGDSMQAIYKDGIGDVKEYIKEKYLIKIIKEDNFRCSEQVVKFINKLRNDDLIQQVAFKVNENFKLETLENRQGTVKLFYGIYDNKPKQNSSVDDKNDYMRALNILIEEANKNSDDCRTLLLTNKSISSKGGFETLYTAFSKRYSDPKDTIDKHLMSLQLFDLSELCIAYESKNYNFILSKIMRNGYSVKRIEDKIQIKENFNQIINSDKGALGALELAFELKLLKRSDRFSEYLNRKDLFLKDLSENVEYFSFKKLYQDGNNTYSRMKKIINELEEEEFNELEKYVKKENFYVDLFSNNLKFREIINYSNYINEKTQYITMHKTKGSGIDNVLVVLDEYFWNDYDFNTVFDSTEDNEKKKHRNQKLVYVACSRAKVNLTCVKLVTSNEKQEILKFFNDAVEIECKPVTSF